MVCIDCTCVATTDRLMDDVHPWFNSLYTQILDDFKARGGTICSSTHCIMTAGPASWDIMVAKVMPAVQLMLLAVLNRCCCEHMRRLLQCCWFAAVAVWDKAQ